MVFQTHLCRTSLFCPIGGQSGAGQSSGQSGRPHRRARCQTRGRERVGGRRRRGKWTLRSVRNRGCHRSVQNQRIGAQHAFKWKRKWLAATANVQHLTCPLTFCGGAQSGEAQNLALRTFGCWVNGRCWQGPSARMAMTWQRSSE